MLGCAAASGVARGPRLPHVSILARRQTGPSTPNVVPSRFPNGTDRRLSATGAVGPSPVDRVSQSRLTAAGVGRDDPVSSVAGHRLVNTPCAGREAGRASSFSFDLYPRGGNSVAPQHPAPTAKQVGAKRPKLACLSRSAPRTTTSDRCRGVLVVKGSVVRIRSSAPRNPRGCWDLVSPWLCGSGSNRARCDACGNRGRPAGLAAGTSGLRPRSP